MVSEVRCFACELGLLGDDHPHIERPADVPKYLVVNAVTNDEPFFWTAE